MVKKTQFKENKCSYKNANGCVASYFYFSSYKVSDQSMTTFEFNLSTFPNETLANTSAYFTPDYTLFSKNSSDLTNIQESSNNTKTNGEYQEDEDDHASVNYYGEEIDTDYDESAPTPVLLTYNFTKTPIFTNSESNSTNSKPLFHDNCHLFRKPLVEFMEALKKHYSINNDIALYFPQLKLKFYTHMPYSEVS